MSEGALFKNQVGDAWSRAPENIRRRFDHDPGPGEVVKYLGVMSEVQCSLVGKVVGWMVQFTGALMPHVGRDVPVEIEVWANERSGAVHKRRVYRFRDRKPFLFVSRMELESSGRIAEHVGGGFGMYLVVSVGDEALHFTDDGYFLQIGAYRVSIPGWLSPGRVRLTHADAGAEEFTIAIDILHPQFGRLFWQEGRFCHARSTGA